MLQSLKSQTTDIFRGLVHKVLPERVPLFPKTEQVFCDLLTKRINAGGNALVVIGIQATYEDASGGWGHMVLKRCNLVCEAAIDFKERITFVRELFTRYRTEGVVNLNDLKQCKTVGFVSAGLQRTRILDRVPQAEVQIMSGGGPLTPEEIINIVGNAEIYDLKVREVAKLFGVDIESTEAQSEGVASALVFPQRENFKPI